VPRLAKAWALRPGQRIGIAAPAARVDAALLAACERELHELGWPTLRRDDPTAACGYFAGDDARRVRELVALLEDDEVGAIVCARGGYGCHRFVDRLAPALFRRHRKPLVGYSDVTTLLLWQRRRAGLTGVHGPMLERCGDAHRASIEAMLALLCGERPAPMAGEGVVGGRVEGRLTGGSLTLVAASLGTPWEIDTSDAILLLEDIGEPPFRIDRMMQSLRVAGKLERCAGIGVGAMVACDDPRFPEWTAEGILRELAEAHGLPLVIGLPFGHVDAHRAWTLGARAVLDGDRGTLEQLESGVSQRS
jgi:muramoyltetrapeptide carboxypeptidase